GSDDDRAFRRPAPAASVGGAAAAPQPDVERALAAMRDVRVLEADHKVAKVRQGQPLGHLAAQNATLAVAASAFAGDDEHQPGAARARGAQEVQERAVRLRLRQPVQIHAPVYRLAAARDTLARAAV